MEKALQIMEKLLQTFEGLIRRSIAPSVTLFVMAGIVDLVLAELTCGTAAQRLEKGLDQLKPVFGGSSKISFVAAAILIIGLSYGLALVQQVIFDNRLRRDFSPWPLWEWLRKRWSGPVDREPEKSEAKALSELREKVVHRLTKEFGLRRLGHLKASSDYILYEILGGIDPTDTRPFVDSAKALGVTCISVIFALLGGLLVHWDTLDEWGRGSLVALAFLIYCLGRAAIVAQFRARAFRLYVNFLMMPTERLEKQLLGLKPESFETTKKETKTENQ